MTIPRSTGAISLFVDNTQDEVELVNGPINRSWADAPPASPTPMATSACSPEAHTEEPDDGRGRRAECTCGEPSTTV
jgi:hypothetical protein